MIGFYDYTVILTYLSLCSAVCGTIISILGTGHPYMGSFFLLFCGLCDTFDGMVARKKPNRTESEKCFGMQIDSLSDLVAFGVLPAAIGTGLLTSGGRHLSAITGTGVARLYSVLYFIVLLFYVLAAMIRLAYFNVLEIEHRGVDEQGNKQYIGLPVTSAALIFPMILLFNFMTTRDFSLLYCIAMPLVGGLFLGRFRVKKPGMRTIFILLGLGVVEFILLIYLRLVLNY